MCCLIETSCDQHCQHSCGSSEESEQLLDDKNENNGKISDSVDYPFDHPHYVNSDNDDKTNNCSHDGHKIDMPQNYPEVMEIEDNKILESFQRAVMVRINEVKYLPDWKRLKKLNLMS